MADIMKDCSNFIRQELEKEGHQHALKFGSNQLTDMLRSEVLDKATSSMRQRQQRLEDELEQFESTKDKNAEVSLACLGQAASLPVL